MNKYGAKKIQVDGMTFDSKAEYKRWCELKLMERAGEIIDLKRQVPFTICESWKIDGITSRERKYIADFVYYEKYYADDKTIMWKQVVEDVKGYTKGAAYNMFSLKKALMGKFYGVVVKEIRKGNIR